MHVNAIIKIKAGFKFLLKSNERIKDILAISLLSLLLIIYLIPGLIGLEKLYFDDVSLTFSRLFGVSRLVQNGEFPLWDPYSFTGARPYFVMVESPIYNVFFYPLFLIANINNINQSFFVLYLIPYSLLVIFAGLGVYFFTRKILQFGITASFVSSLLYATAPFMACSIKSIHDTHIYAFIPWVLMFIFLFIRTNRIRWWLASILFMVFLSVSVTLNTLVRAYFIIVLIVFFSTLLLFIRKKIKFSVLVNAVLAFAVSSGILAFIWFGMIEGIRWVETGQSLKYSELVADPHYSMFPGYLMNLFMQDFHGLVSCSHTWGNALRYDNNILLSGGFVPSLLVVLSVFLFIRKFRTLPYRKKVFFFIFLSIFILTIIVMLGKFTPVYWFFCMTIPWVFKIPYVFYFLFYQGFTYSILVGYGLDFLSDPAVREELGKSRLVYVYSAAVVLLLAAAFFEPVYTSKNFMFSIQSLLSLKELNWFLVNKVSFLALCIAVSIASFANMKKSFFFAAVLAALVAGESLFFGYISLYRNTVSPRLTEQNNIYKIIFRTHYGRPTDYPMTKDVEEFRKFYADKDVRFIGAISSIDNISWLIGK